MSALMGALGCGFSGWGAVPTGDERLVIRYIAVGTSALETTASESPQETEPVFENESEPSTTVAEVQALVAAMSSAAELAKQDTSAQQAAYAQVESAYAAYMELAEEQRADRGRGSRRHRNGQRCQ